MDALILSYALDTNGQNQRFVQAARKHGQRVMKVLAIGNDDPAGVVGRYMLAAEKLGGLSIRSVHRASHYFDFPRDIEWTRENEPLIQRLMLKADVIHLNNSYRSVQRYRLQKPMLLHHHGSLFRNNPAHMLGVAKAKRWVQAVSTIDLQRPAPDVLHWLPTAYDITELQAFARRRSVLKTRIRPDGKVRIVHAPTNRPLKATDALIAAVKHLQAEGLPVELVLVEGQTWQDCLTAKATADIVFDQTLFGYGCNAVEAWGMGIPVMAGADDWTLAAMRKEFGELPFYLTTEDTITDRLRELVLSADLRAEYAAKGLAHVRKYHDERPALAKLAELYVEAMATYQSPRHSKAADAVRFRSTGAPRSVSIDGESVRITQEGSDVTDPFLISRLRYFAQKRRNLGIEEVAG